MKGGGGSSNIPLDIGGVEIIQKKKPV